VKNPLSRPFGFASGWQKRRHSERSTSGVKNLILFRVSNSEESPQETLRLRLRVTGKKSVTGKKGWQKEVILSFLFCHSER